MQACTRTQTHILMLKAHALCVIAHDDDDDIAVATTTDADVCRQHAARTAWPIWPMHAAAARCASCAALARNWSNGSCLSFYSRALDCVSIYVFAYVFKIFKKSLIGKRDAFMYTHAYAARALTCTSRHTYIVYAVF